MHYLRTVMITVARHRRGRACRAIHGATVAVQTTPVLARYYKEECRDLINTSRLWIKYGRLMAVKE